MKRHTLSVLVQDEPGVLARVAALFARRGFNIESLAVGNTELEGISRMTIVVNVEDSPLEQVTKQLNKLINVLKIVELDATQAVEHQLIMVKVRAEQDTRSQVIEVAELFHCKIVDVSPESIAMEATGTHDKIQTLLNMLAPYGIKELVQSGVVALARGPRSITDRQGK
jgi:acetolactate synthase-1/3 small subunit